MSGYQMKQHYALVKNGIDFLQAFTFPKMFQPNSSNQNSEANYPLILANGLLV